MMGVKFWTTYLVFTQRNPPPSFSTSVSRNKNKGGFKLNVRRGPLRGAPGPCFPLGVAP